MDTNNESQNMFISATSFKESPFMDSIPTTNNNNNPDLFNLKLNQTYPKRTMANKESINDKIVNIGFESIKINGAIQFKQLRNPLTNQQHSSPTTSISLVTCSTPSTLTSKTITTVTSTLPQTTTTIKYFSNELKDKDHNKLNILNKKTESIDICNNFPYDLQTDDLLLKNNLVKTPSNSNSKFSNNNINEESVLINNNNNNISGDLNVGGNSTRLTVRSASNSSGKKEKKSSVGYRLGKRKLLFEKRRRISDYALIFAMTGVLLMIIENEFSMANIYSKVS
jgi:hypothetical protein